MGGGGGTPRPALTDEECAELAKAGAGSYGHCTIIEPADLDVYESYMYAPLAMPEKPEVMLSYWDMNRGVAPFMEGRVMVKALCPDGIESWLVISVPVPNFYTCVEGNCWGWPKYVCDEMTVEKDHSEVIYEGKVRLSMDFTPGGLDEAAIEKLKAPRHRRRQYHFVRHRWRRRLLDAAGARPGRHQSRPQLLCRMGSRHDQDLHAAGGQVLPPATGKLCHPRLLAVVHWQGGGPAGGMFKVTG